MTISQPGAPVQVYGGLVLQASHDVGTVGSIDVLVVPGTIAVDAASSHAPLTSALRILAGATPLVTSVCTGSILLERAGLLAGVAGATTHHDDLHLLADAIGDGATTARWVDAGPVVTAGGLSSGLAMALHLVDRLVDRDLAIATAVQLAYDWDPDDGAVADIP